MSQKHYSKKIAWFLVVACLISSSAYVLTKTNLWREISESDAKSRALTLPSFAPIVEKTQPAVVVITTEAVVEQQPLEFPGLPGPFKFFLPQGPEKMRGQGSGFIINEDGYIITNQHVIENAQKIRVRVGNDAIEYNAKVIGFDEPLDIALIKLETESKEKRKWPYLPLGDSDSVRLGDWTLALGSPLGLVQSVNFGIVSQKHRGGIKPSGRDLFVELMQLQMPINPGNSGGPVVDMSGRVVGVSESISSGQSIAFCVPINIIKAMMPQLLAHGQIEKAYLGVEPTDLTPQYAKALGLPQNETGAVVLQVMPSTPAEKAGLKPMDVILEFDGNKVNGQFNLRQQTAYGGVGRHATLKIYRKGVGTIAKVVHLEKRPGQPEMAASVQTPNTSDKIVVEGVGLEVRNTPPNIVKEMSLPVPGAEIVGVLSRSPAEFVGLEPRDIIIKVNDVGILSAKAFKEVVDKAPAESTLLVLTRRGSTERFVPLIKR